jgi:sugar-phosphatase
MSRLTAKALLFDLDGTLVHSLPAVERAWKTFARRHALDETNIFERIHGRRSIDSIRQLLPHVDPEVEDAFIRNLEATDTEGVHALPGAVELLESLEPGRWAIVTSGTSDVAMARWRAAGLPRPTVFVYGEEVANGKPAPDPFLLGAKKLGVEPESCLGFEDASAGMASIFAAGMQGVGVGIAATYSIQNYLNVKVFNIGPDMVVEIPD